MTISKKNKKKHGVFYTTGSDIIFNLIPFKKWWHEHKLDVIFQNQDKDNKQKLLEPFAGNNDIIKSLIKLKFINENQFQPFDISPQNNVFIEKLDHQNKIELLEIKTIKKNVLKHFPKGFLVSVTNPPYFAKNSASKQKINIDFKYDIVSDLYETCLIELLKHCDFIAAIIPETFINSDLSIKKYLDCFISLISNGDQNNIYFSDTEHPVCLALFSKKTKNILVNKINIAQNNNLNFDVYQNNLFLGKYSDLIKKENQFLIKNKSNNKTFDFLINELVHKEKIEKIVFNDPNGLINIQCLDNTKNSSIFMTMNNIVESKDVKQSSRSKTKISLYNKKGELILDKDFLNQFCLAFNEKFNLYRQETHDLFLTSFRGLREDGYYRKRLDFKKIKMLLGL